MLSELRFYPFEVRLQMVGEVLCVEWVENCVSAQKSRACVARADG